MVWEVILWFTLRVVKMSYRDSSYGIIPIKFRSADSVAIEVKLRGRVGVDRRTAQRWDSALLQNKMCQMIKNSVWTIPCSSTSDGGHPQINSQHQPCIRQMIQTFGTDNRFTHEGTSVNVSFINPSGWWVSWWPGLRCALQHFNLSIRSVPQNFKTTVKRPTKVLLNLSAVQFLRKKSPLCLVWPIWTNSICIFYGTLWCIQNVTNCNWSEYKKSFFAAFPDSAQQIPSLQLSYLSLETARRTDRFIDTYK